MLFFIIMHISLDKLQLTKVKSIAFTIPAVQLQRIKCTNSAANTSLYMRCVLMLKGSFNLLTKGNSIV